MKMGFGIPALLCLASLLSAAPAFEIRFSRDARATPVDVRLIVVIAARGTPEPRFQVGWDVATAQVFAIDVENWKPGETIRVGDTATGAPLGSLRDLRPGNYTGQAVLNVDETGKRADRHTIRVPGDDGEGQHGYTSPGDVTTTPNATHVGSHSASAI